MTKSDFDKLYNLELAKSLSEPDQDVVINPADFDSSSTGIDHVLAQLLIRNLINRLNNQGESVQIRNFSFEASVTGLKTLSLEILVGKI